MTRSDEGSAKGFEAWQLLKEEQKNEGWTQGDCERKRGCSRCLYRQAGPLCGQWASDQ